MIINNIVGGNMKIEYLIEEYLKVVQLRHAAGTYEFNRNHLNHFKNFVLKKGLRDVDEITDQVVIDYVGHMKMTCENVTINKNIGALKRCFRHMKVDFPYLQGIEKFKERKKSFNAIDHEDFIRFRKIVRNMECSSSNGAMYKCLLALLCDTGARIKEILLIERKNVDLDNKEILLTHTKTNEDRVIYLTELLGVPAVAAMMKVKCDHKYLLHNTLKNRPCKYDDVIYLMRVVKKQMGWSKLHPHMFRHTAATALIERGMDLASIMIILGHKNLKTTERYLHVSKSHVRKKYQSIMNDLD